MIVRIACAGLAGEVAAAHPRSTSGGRGSRRTATAARRSSLVVVVVRLCVRPDGRIRTSPTTTTATSDDRAR